MTLSELVRLLLRRRWLIIGTTVVAVMIAVAFLALSGVTYRARAQVLITQPQAATPGQEGEATASRIILQAVTLAQVATAPGFVADAARTAGISVGDALVSASSPVNTAVVQVSVSSHDRLHSALVAKAIVAGLRRSVDAQQSTLPDEEKVTLLNIEDPVGLAASLHPTFVLLIALVAGFALSSTVALLLESS